MKNEQKSLIFFGSGPVAAASLKLLKGSFMIEAVVTKTTTKNEMSVVAEDSPVFCVDNKADLDKLFEQDNFTSELGILIDFGIIVNKKIIDYFPKGIVNSHFSLLPELRGADPISFAILEGKSRTGVSLMLLVEAMDEGPILSVGLNELNGTETTPKLTDDLIQLSYVLLENTIPKYLSGEITPTNQQLVANKFSITQSYTRKLTKSDGIIDWNKPAQQIERELRAFAEWPKSRTSLNGTDCIIEAASILDKNGVAGTLFIDGKKLAVYCGQQALVIESLRPAGKKTMNSEAFLAGYRQRIGL